MSSKVAKAEKPKAPVIGITEYCRRLSTREKRVELIGAFHHAMKAEEVYSDTEEGYDARFARFEKQPA